MSFATPTTESTTPRAETPAADHPQVTFGSKRWTAGVRSPRLVSFSWAVVTPGYTKR